jgi:hypothetical protein
VLKVFDDLLLILELMDRLSPGDFCGQNDLSGSETSVIQNKNQRLNFQNLLCLELNCNKLGKIYFEILYSWAKTTPYFVLFIYLFVVYLRRSL